MAVRPKHPLPSPPELLVLDTCVLVSTPLRLLLLQLAQDGCFFPLWSRPIGDEWRRTVYHLWQQERHLVDRHWNDLQDSFPQADLGEVNGFMDGLVYSDSKDWHVIAAARLALQRHPGKAVGIMTRNTRDFNLSELRRLHLQRWDPDQFLSRLWQQQAGKISPRLTKLPERAAKLTGREPETLWQLLRRERLFRFSRLVATAKNTK